MQLHYYCGTIADTAITFAFRHKEASRYFGDWLSPCGKKDTAIRIQKKDTEEWIRRWGRLDDPYTEYGLSVYRASDYLLSFGKCAFHAAAFLWKGNAFLFTAPSGTGKSTQLGNWMQLYPDETIIMNGDKPILSKENDIIQVWPSPWKGKERLGDDSLKAPLGGIIFLRQSQTNIIRRLTPYDSAVPILERFLCTVENEETIHSICRLEEAILSSVPVWEFQNIGDIASTRIVRDRIVEELGI